MDACIRLGCECFFHILSALLGRFAIFYRASFCAKLWRYTASASWVRHISFFGIYVRACFRSVVCAYKQRYQALFRKVKKGERLLSFLFVWCRAVGVFVNICVDTGLILWYFEVCKFLFCNLLILFKNEYISCAFLFNSFYFRSAGWILFSICF